MIRRIVLLAVVLLGLAGCGFTTVDTGFRGVKTEWNKVIAGDGGQMSLPEGFYTYNPFSDDIIQMDTRIQKWDANTLGYTKDVQQANIHFTMNYRLDPSNVHIVYQSVGRDWAEKLIAQIAYEEVKNEFGQHEAVEIISKRDEASSNIRLKIKEKLADKYVLLEGFQITNIDYSDVFEHAVEAKVVADQNALEAANKTKQAEQVKRQAILEAEGQAESIRIRAQALEKNPRLVEWEAVQKWDGKQCTSSCFGSASVVPLINVPGK